MANFLGISIWLILLVSFSQNSMADESIQNNSSGLFPGSNNFAGSISGSDTLIAMESNRRSKIFASEEKPTQEKSKRAKLRNAAADSSSSSSEERTSLGERRSKKYEMIGGGNHAFAGGYLIPGIGGLLGYYWSPNTLVEIGGRLGMTLSKPTISVMEGTAGIRHFFTNYLYFGLGGGINLYNATHEETTSTTFDRWKENAITWRPYGSIGAQWQWKLWALNIEFANIGYNVGLQKISNDIPTNSNGDPAATSGESALKKIVAAPSFETKFMLGFSF